MVTSDHGLICDTNAEGPALKGDADGVNAKIMSDLGYTVLKRDEQGNLLKEIDWSQTKAVATGTNHIFLNIPQSIVPSVRCSLHIPLGKKRIEWFQSLRRLRRVCFCP